MSLLRIMKDDLREISFYHLTALPIQKAAPKLIEKIYYSKQKLVVICPNEELVKTLDDGLWAYSTKHFIPHGTCEDEHKDRQPVYISYKLENPSQAEIIMTIANVELDSLDASKILHLFDGNDAKQLEFARARWKYYKQNKAKLTYWQQKIDGSWESKV